MAEKKTTEIERVTERKRNYSFRVRREAFNLYLDDVPPREISARLDIPEATLKGWITAKEWKDKKEAAQAELMKSTYDQFRGLVEKHQFLTLKRKLRTAALLDKSIQNCLILPDGSMAKLTPERLRDLALAFKSSSDIDTKLLGLIGPNAQTTVIASRGSFVNIGVQGSPLGSLPPPERSEQIVQSEVSRPPYDGPLVPDSGIPF